MAWLPIAQTTPQYVDSNGDPAVGYVLKFYSAGTSSNILLAVDNTGSPTATDVALNADGNPEISGTVIIPHLEESFKIVLYPTQAAADSDSGATWTIDNISLPITSISSVDEKVRVSSNDTTPGYLNGKAVAGVGVFLTENLDGADETLGFASKAIGSDVASAAALTLGANGTYYDITGTTAITSITTVGVGSVIRLHFDAALVLTHHSTNLVLPGGVNITTAAGDEAEFVEYATGDWRLTRYLRYSDGGINTRLGLTGVLYGLTTAHDTDIDHDILINVGNCSDSTNAVTMDLTAILTKQIDLDWAEGDDEGGLAIGSRSVVNIPNASTWYHLFLISKTDGTVDGGWDTSLTAANLLSDANAYSYYRRIASHYVNASNNIDLYDQYDDKFEWRVPVNSAQSAAVPDSEQNVTLRTPIGFVHQAEISVIAESAGNAGFIRVYGGNVTNASPTATNALFEGLADTATQAARFFITTDTASVIHYRGTVVAADLFINSLGWIDNRGKF